MLKNPPCAKPEFASHFSKILVNLCHFVKSTILNTGCKKKILVLYGFCDRNIIHLTFRNLLKRSANVHVCNSNWQWEVTEKYPINTTMWRQYSALMSITLAHLWCFIPRKSSSEKKSRSLPYFAPNFQIHFLWARKCPNLTSELA